MPATKSKPAVASDVVYVDAHGDEHPAVVHSHPEDGVGVNLFVLGPLTSQFVRNAPEQEHKGDVEVWHR